MTSHDSRTGHRDGSEPIRDADSWMSENVDGRRYDPTARATQRPRQEEQQPPRFPSLVVSAADADLVRLWEEKQVTRSTREGQSDADATGTVETFSGKHRRERPVEATTNARAGRSRSRHAPGSDERDERRAAPQLARANEAPELMRPRHLAIAWNDCKHDFVYDNENWAIRCVCCLRARSKNNYVVWEGSIDAISKDAYNVRSCCVEHAQTSNHVACKADSSYLRLAADSKKFLTVDSLLTLDVTQSWESYKHHFVYDADHWVVRCICCPGKHNANTYLNLMQGSPEAINNKKADVIHACVMHALEYKHKDNIAGRSRNNLAPDARTYLSMDSLFTRSEQHPGDPYIPSAQSASDRTGRRNTTYI